MFKLVKNLLGEYGVEGPDGSLYPVGTKGHRWTLEPIYWTHDKGEALKHKTGHEERYNTSKMRNTYESAE